MFWKRKTKTPQELMAAGDYKGAIKGFRAQIKERKDQDPALLMQLAGACLKAGKTQDAKDVYSEVGTYYGDRGFFNKSVAAFKKALNITPDDTQILEKLAGYNDKVPKFMIDASILQRLKAQAETHKTGEHAALTAEDLAAASATQEHDAVEDLSDHDLIEEPPPAPETAAAPAVEEDTQPAPDVFAEVPVASHTAELDRDAVMEAARKLAAEAPPAPPKKQSPPPPSLDQSFEEITDLDLLDEEAEPAFVMDFGAAQPPEPPGGPLTVPPAAAEAPQEGGKTQLGQPLTRGGMVFKTQNAPEKPASRSTGFFDSVDDALDNIFSGGGDGGGDLFGLDDSIIDMGDGERDSSTEISMADASPEENAKHWPLFRTMPQDVFMALVMALETRDYEEGDLIVREGDPGDEMFLIADGEVDVIVTIGGHPTKVATLGEGDFFGEASLLSGAPRNATVRTAGPTNCLLLNAKDLAKLVKEHPSVMASIESIYYTRIQENATRKNSAGE